MIKKLREFNIINNIQVVEKHEALYKIDEFGFPIGIENDVTVINERLSIKLPIEIYSKPIKIYQTVLDAIADVSIINNIYKCPICGTVYEFTNHMQRNICKECYLKQRRAKAAQHKREIRSKK